MKNDVSRVVSLLPSATEIVAALGGSHLLVGKSHECDFPPDLDLPILTAQRVDAPALSFAEIDRQVRECLDLGRSLYSLDTQMLEALKPDVILTQDLCRVCSIDLESVRRLARAMPGPPRLVSLNATTLEGVLDDGVLVADALGLDALPLVTSLRERLFAAQEFVNPYADAPSVALLEWTDPLFCAGHWTPQMIERAGGSHPLNPTIADERAGAAVGPQHAARRASPSRAITPDELVSTRPEFLIIAPCGLSLARARAAARELAGRPWWRDLPAARSGRVAIVDGNQMFNRPSPRLLDAFEWLVGFLNDRPELTPKGFPWEKFT